MPAHRFMVIEAVSSDPKSFEELRRWVASKIREGDGFYEESGRLFMLIPSINMVGALAVVQRLGPEADALGGSLVVKAFGDDDVSDSLYRRADAQILPVEPRGQEGTRE